MLAGVIWMLGWCMVLMAALVHLPIIANSVLGIAIIALHNVTDFLPLGPTVEHSAASWFWQVLYFGGGFQLRPHGPPLLILYVIVPWIGVMMAGYAFGAVMQLPEERRRTITLRLGVGVTLAFIVLRAIDLYGDPRHWSGGGQNALAFLATTKYPASLLFLLMTLGPMFIGLSLAERTGVRGSVSEVLATFGRVPLFYYLLHIPLIHAAACVVSLFREGRVNPWLFANHPLDPGPVPPGYRWSLGLLYLVFAVCVTLLYVPCRWYSRLKAQRRSVWLSYL
jgi:uncharacterized membrane protein